MISDVASAREDAFRDLAALVRLWRAEGKRTTLAGLKPAMRGVRPEFDESALGFGKFHEFVAAGQDAGFVKLYDPPTGHRLVLLPDEDVAEVRDVPVQKSDERLRPAVWSVFVEWHDDWVRQWDRDECRPLWYPIADDGRPAWETDTDRFVSIEPISREVQMGWMREWSEAVPEPGRSELLASIGDDAPPGDFRAVLGRLGLVGSWRDDLRNRTRAHALDWANANNVNPATLVESRRTPTGPRPAAPVTNTSADPKVSVASSYEEQVRDRVRDAVDRMTLDELLELRLPVRAVVGRR